MATKINCLGSLHVLPPEIRARIFNFAHATDDLGSDQLGPQARIEFIYQERTETFHHSRINSPFIKEVRVPFLQTSRALALVSKQIAQDSEDELFRRTSVELVFGHELACLINISSNARAKYMALYRYVPLLPLLGTLHYPNIWIDVSFSLPSHGQASAATWGIDASNNASSESLRRNNAKRDLLVERVGPVLGWIQALLRWNAFTAEALWEILDAFLYEDAEMEVGRKPLDRNLASIA